MDIYLKYFSHPKFYKWNTFLLNLAYKGLGINQWQNTIVSGEQNFLQNILPKKCQTIFDVGAYRGSYSKAARSFHSNSKIYAFEPNPRSFPHLYSLSGQQDFTAYPLALGSSSGLGRLYDDSRKNGGTPRATLYESAFSRLGIPTIDHEIRLTTLDAFCKEQGIEHIDLLKIDAEGFEYAILKGAHRMIGSLSIDIIQFEWNYHSLISGKNLFDFMELLPHYDFYRLLYRGMLPLNPQARPMGFAEHQNIIAWSQQARYIYDPQLNQTRQNL